MGFAQMFPQLLDQDMLDPATYPSDEDRARALADAETMVSKQARDVENNADTIAAVQDAPQVPMTGPLPTFDDATRSMQPPPIERLPQARQQPAPTPPPSNGYDWRRAVTSLFEGGEGVGRLDQSRMQQDRLEMDKRAALLQAAREARLAEGENFALGEKRVAAQNAAAARDPNSPISQSMRGDAIDQAQAFGRLYPEGKDLADSWIARFRGMSGADIMHAQTSAGKIMDMFRNAAKDEAAMKLAEANMGLKQRAIAGTEQERADRRDEREEARTEKDVAALGKETGPLNEALFNANDALEQKKKVSTGRLQSFIHDIRKAVGIPNKDMVALESAEGALGAGIRHAISGSAISESEGSYLLKQLADLKQSDSEYEIKLNKIKDRLIYAVNEAKKRHPRGAAGTQGGTDKKSANIARAKEIIADPKETPEKKAKAEAWLKLNAQ
jgi:hypothetical protein